MNRLTTHIRHVSGIQFLSDVLRSIGQSTTLVIRILTAVSAIYIYWLINPDSVEERKDALTMIGTGIAAIALVGNLIVTSRSLDHQKTSQRDERFFRASEQLGAESEAARIGALFSLERLSKESDNYYEQVVEIICSFARKRSDDI